jgi:hypothetical protein
MLFAVTIVAAVASGCAGCSEEEDLCESVTCEFGVCDPDSGTCRNADPCSGDGQCLEGFQCSNDICLPLTACNDDGTCDRGECQNGACVNPDSCTTNTNCAEGSWCDGGQCVDDPCAETTCERGVCQIGVGECVNAETCTTATEEDACLDGFRCASGSCVNEQMFCDELGCDRGICDFENQACANAENCEGSDENCLDGYFCDADNTCRENECDADMVMCDRGVCEPSSGDCINADPCTAEGECTDGFLCVDDTCVATEDACQMGGCPGNQICDYDGATLTATCSENDMEGCTSGLDCTGERVCDMGTCAEPAACTDDAFEPNDDDANAVDFIAESEAGSIADLSICGGDVDVFTFDTTEDPQTEGTLFARVDLDPVDVGLGTVKAEILDTDGAVAAEATNVDDQGNTLGFVEVSTTVDVVDNGVYTIRVSDDGDVSTAGIRYDLTVDLVPADVTDTCGSATALQAGAPVTASTGDATGTSLASSCANDSVNLGDNVYTFTVTEDSWVTAQVTPQTGVDVALSLRGSCPSNDSEIACSEGAGAASAETISMAVGPGTYYLLVEPVGSAGGSYVISYTAEPQVCTSADDSCLDADNASICNDRQTGFDTVMCENGCDMNLGRCNRLQGDVCSTAFQVDAATGYSGTVNLNDLENDYDPGPGVCVPDNASSDDTNAQDAVFTVTVPDDQVVVGEALNSSSDDIAWYIVTDCSDVAAYCVAGANDVGFSSSESETVFWHNDTGMDQTVYMVLDIGDDESTIGTSEVDISVAPFVCTPGETRCRLDRESQRCNDAGTGFDTATFCDNGCDDTTGECLITNDVCGGATDVTPSSFPGTTQVTGDFSSFVSDYDSCGAGSGPDSVYVLSGVPANHTVTADLSSGEDTVIAAATGCDMDQLDTCFDYADNGFGGDTESISFVADGTSDYYIVAKAYYGSTNSGAFTLDISVDPPACTNFGTITGCNMAGDGMDYCSNTGQLETVPCDLSGCDSGTDRCVNPTGQVCADAIALDPTGGSLTDVDFDNTGFNSIELPSGGTANCSYFGTAGTGNEVIYSIDLDQGEELSVNFEDSSTFGTGQVYLLSDCASTDTCQGYDSDGSANLTYFASQTETVYFVVDASSGASSFTYDLDWSVVDTGMICQPGTRSCADATTIQTCDEDGLAFDFTACPTACDGGACTDDAMASDVCSATVPDIGTGLTVAIVPNEHTNTIDITTDACFDTSSFGTGGPDAVYQAMIPANNILRVKGYQNGSGSWPAVYTFTDCADAEGSCLTGQAAMSSSEMPEFIYQAGASAESVYIGLDSDFSTTSTSPWIFEMEVVVPECQEGDPVVCNADGDALEYCDRGFVEEYLCSGGACSNDACDNPRGDACFDTIALTGSGGSESASWSNDEDTSNPGTAAGACSFGSSPDGVDDVYSVSLDANDILEATVSSDEDTLEVYVLETCGDTDTCVDNAAGDGAGEPAEVAYYTDTARDVFLVVDRSDGDSDGSYTLDWSITQNGACAPDRWACLDANTVGLCDAAGSGFDSQFGCNNGCADGLCTDSAASGDTCPGAEALTGGTHTRVALADYANDLEQDTTNGCLAADDTDGNEVIYTVDLLANDVLRVDATAIGTTADPAIYVVSDCQNPLSTCVAGTAADDSASLQYQAQFDETVFVVVDSDFSTTTGEMAIDIEVLSPDCDPTTFSQTCNMAGDGFLFCDDTGFTQEYLCQNNGVCDAATGRCEEPVGDECIDPIDANPSTTGTPLTLSGTLADYTDDYDLGTGNQCTLSRTIAPEPVYFVELNAGQELTVDVVSTEASPEDLAVFATTACDDVRSQCVAGADDVAAEATAETFTYTAAQDETIYLMVDSFFADAAGGYDLTVEIN